MKQLRWGAVFAVALSVSALVIVWIGDAVDAIGTALVALVFAVLSFYE